jgi:hypothetical protein
MMSRTKTLAISIAMGAAVLFTPTASVAAQTTVGDGLVNVAVGDITIARNVDVAVVADVVAQVCGVDVGPVNVLARQVDLSGEPVTICQSPQGPVTIRQ